MSSVAAHPSAPAAARHSSSRFGQLLKPLRKSTSTKDLHKVAAYDSYQTTSPPLLLNTNTSPLDDAWQSAGSRSPMSAYTPPVSFGFTSNKARLGRALGEPNRGEGRWADDADYIPYRGPISPPPESTSSFAQQQQQRPENRRLPLQAQHSNLIGVDAASSGPSFVHSGQQSDREAAPSIPRFRDVQYAPSTSTATPDSNDREWNPSTTGGRLIGTGLPSAYSHGGNAPSQGSSSAIRSVANQSYLPSLLRFSTSADAGSSSNLKQTRDVQIRQPVSTISRMPVATSPPLVKPSFPTVDRIDHTSKAASLSSSDGHHSSLINQESRSTSMTSLRDQSSIHGSKFRRPSQEGPPLSASAKSHSKIISSPSITQTAFQQHESASSHHRKTDSSSTTASVPALARNFVEGHNAESLSQDDEATPKAGKRLQREVVPASPLSTVPASTPDLRSSQSAADTSPAKHDASRQQGQGSPTPRRGREDANQKYLLLQQMRLDEAASHAPDNDGWLEPNSGCERLLMPKPALKGKKSAPEVRSSEGVSFERNRRGQLDNGESSSMADAATAQAILSGAEYSSKAERTEATDNTPILSHHRMPPATPDVNRDASATPLTRPAHVNIPPRRSSQSRRQRAKSATPATSTRRPAKDDDDNDSVPDLATVLAQGRALDEERERWREQYRRSLMKARVERSKSRDGLSKKVRYHEKPLPDIPSLQDRTPTHLQTPIRQAKSTPDMRKSMSRGAYKDTKDAGVLDMCIAPFRDTSHQQPRDQQQQQKQHLRKRSQSQGCLASAFSFSRKSRRQRAASLSPDVETEKAATSGGEVREKPAVDGRAATSKSRNVTGDKAGDSKAFRFPFTKTATPSTIMPSDTSYGIAYSAPRPSIGQAVPKEETFAAGRHATTKQYHMHTNSDDIRVMLSSSGHQSEEDHLQQKQDGQGSETDTRGRSATSRGDSLGLSHVTQLNGDLKQASDTAAQAPPLPIHPLEKKKSQASPASVSVNLHPPTLVGALKGFPAADDQRKTPVSSTAVLNSEAKAFPKMEHLEADTERPEGSQSLGPLQQQKFLNRRGSRRSKDNAKRLTAQSTASTSSSSYSPHSVAARELWNTDDHPEEAFQELFVRRPGIAGQSLTKGGVEGVPRIVEPQSPLQTGDFATRDFEHSLRNESRTGDSLYRASLDSKRDSAHIEKLVGSYLSTLSPPIQTDETLERTGMQESDVDLYRQGIRLGRVGSGRTPVISPAYHSANEQDGPSDEEYEEPRMSSTRARMDSLAASLVLPTEGNSPDLHEAPLPPSEAKEVISDQVDEETEKQHSTDRSSNESLINIVRNIVWPDPPKNSKKE